MFLPVFLSSSPTEKLKRRKKRFCRPKRLRKYEIRMCIILFSFFMTLLSTRKILCIVIGVFLEHICRVSTRLESQMWCFWVPLLTILSKKFQVFVDTLQLSKSIKRCFLPKKFKVFWLLGSFFIKYSVFRHNWYKSLPSTFPKIGNMFLVAPNVKN